MKKVLNLVKYISLLNKEKYNLLGRWCHKGVPYCNETVIERKINFALLDNNLCTKQIEIKNSNENRNK